MSSGVIVDAERESERGPESRLPERGQIRVGDAVERWLDGQLNLIVFGVIAGAFLVRAYVAGRSFLNPDEALHYIILNQFSALRAYRMSLTNAHPPLVYLLVYFWRFLGRSELMLRFPTVLCGTALCWAAYKWIGTLFGKAASVIGLILVAFSPSMIALSAELRSYALLLSCEVAALYFIETAFQEKSARKMSYFSVFLYLAILSHYSAIFFAVAAGVYAPARIVESHLPRKLILAWAGGQAGALAICGFLYVTHISKLKDYIALWVTGFDQGYFHSGREGLLSSAGKRTMDVFIFVFENQYVAQALFALWLVGIAILVLRESVFRREIVRGRHSGILLLLPFVAVLGAAMARFYPYVGSRHTAFLAPFLIAALSYVLAAVNRERLWAAIVTAALIAGVSNTKGKAPDPYISKENQSRALMAAAINHIQQTIPQGGPILADYESALLLSYYLCGPKLTLPWGMFGRPVSKLRCNGHSIGSFQTWSLKPEFFLSNFGSMAQAQYLKAGDTVWVFQSGWDVTFNRDLPLTAPQFRCLDSEAFGANISLASFRVGPDFSPLTTVADCPGH